MPTLNYEKILQSQPNASFASETANVNHTKSDGNQSVVMLDIGMLDTIENQPFRRYGPEKMQELAASVKEYGVLSPLLVRPVDNHYVVISGRNRLTAAEMCGLTHVPCMIKDCTEDEANILLVQLNLNQRQELLHSEKAFAYKLLYDSLKRQGKAISSTLGPMDPKLRTSAVMAQQTDESEKQIRRYISLCNLIPQLMELVDAGTLAFRAGVELSMLDSKAQTAVWHFFFVEKKAGLDIRTAEKIKLLFRDGTEITDESLAELLGLNVTKPKKISTFKIRYSKLKKIVPKDITPQQLEEDIIAALTAYYQNKT